MNLFQNSEVGGWEGERSIDVKIMFQVSTRSLLLKATMFFCSVQDSQGANVSFVWNFFGTVGHTVF